MQTLWILEIEEMRTNHLVEECVDYLHSGKSAGSISST